MGNGRIRVPASRPPGGPMRLVESVNTERAYGGNPALMRDGHGRLNTNYPNGRMAPTTSSGPFGLFG